MIDTRAVGQELQDQVLAAARKGHQRVTNTVKNVTATAQMIRPQLPSMPTINSIKLPNAEQLAQLRDKQLSQLTQLREKQATSSEPAHPAAREGARPDQAANC